MYASFLKIRATRLPGRPQYSSRRAKMGFGDFGDRRRGYFDIWPPGEQLAFT
jgi:hypothetical protein